MMELENSRMKLESYRTELESYRMELENSRMKLKSCRAELKDSRTELGNSRKDKMLLNLHYPCMKKEFKDSKITIAQYHDESIQAAAKFDLLEEMFYNFMKCQDDLEKALAETKKELKDHQEENERAVCMEGVREYFFNLCRHVCVCEACKDLFKECPICRSRIDKCLKFFRS